MLGLRPRLRTRNSLYDLIGRRLADDEGQQRTFEERLDDSIVDDELPPLPSPAFSFFSQPRSPFASPLQALSEEEDEAPIMAPVSLELPPNGSALQSLTGTEKFQTESQGGRRGSLWYACRIIRPVNVLMLPTGAIYSISGYL